MNCERCGRPSNYSTGSWFNTDQICWDCGERERAHPDYERARQFEQAAVRRGDFYFPGIGLPPELNVKR